MEFKIDFNQVTESKGRYYLGFVMLVFSIIVLFYGIYTASLFIIPYFLYFSIMGISHIYEGGGKSINSIFGERFLSVDEDKIEFKKKSRKQSIVIYWDSVESIKFATTKVVVNSKENQKIEIEYGKLSYAFVQQLKKILSEIETKKNRN